MNAIVATNASPLRHGPVAIAWGALGGLGAAMVVPYVLKLMPPAQPLPMPIWAVAISAAIQNALLIGLLGWLALRVAYPLGLDTPVMRRLLRCGDARPVSASDWRLAVLLGIGAGVAIVFADRAFAPFMPKLDLPGGAPGAAAGLLASFYGGISEELFLRLIVMSFVAASLARLRRSALTPTIAWSAIAVAALLFGVGHLPAAAKIAPLDAVFITRTLLLNGVVGVICGWLYWRRGLELAIAAHFSADIVLHVLVPLLHAE